MTESARAWVPDVPVPPGETIREILEERGISQTDFALRLGRSEKNVSQLVNGKAPLTHETAIELERVLGVPSAFWNAAEAQYRDVLARQQSYETLAGSAEWAESFPLKEMAANGWIARESSPEEQTRELLEYFGVSSVDAYGQYWSSGRRLAARMSTAYTADTPATAAWLRAGEIAAEQVGTGPYDERTFRRVLQDLRSATRLSPAEWQPLLTERCAEAGVVVVLVRELPRTRCSAVSWWPTRTRAVIELCLRYKTDDQFWFSFFHESGHLLLDDRRNSRISDLNGDPLAEARADDFAANLLIPPADYASFTSEGRPGRIKVLEFAEQIDIAPGIVVGRLQQDEIIPRDWLNDLKVKLDWAS